MAAAVASRCLPAVARSLLAAALSAASNGDRRVRLSRRCPMPDCRAARSRARLAQPPTSPSSTRLILGWFQSRHKRCRQANAGAQAPGTRHRGQCTRFSVLLPALLASEKSTSVIGELEFRLNAQSVGCNRSGTETTLASLTLLVLLMQIERNDSSAHAPRRRSPRTARRGTARHGTGREGEPWCMWRRLQGAGQGAGAQGARDRAQGSAALIWGESSADPGRRSMRSCAVPAPTAPSHTWATLVAIFRRLCQIDCWVFVRLRQRRRTLVLECAPRMPGHLGRRLLCICVRPGPFQSSTLSRNYRIDSLLLALRVAPDSHSLSPGQR